MASNNTGLERTMDESYFKDEKEHKEHHLNRLVSAAKEIFERNKRAVRIVDLATGPNSFNIDIVDGLEREDIDYEFVLSDISPVHFSIGYENLKKANPKALKNIRCVLMDSCDMKTPLTEIPMWSGNGHPKEMWPIAKVLKDPKYAFLKTCTERPSFSDDTFDMIIGQLPYGSINTGPYQRAIKESVRILRSGGYHIVSEFQVEILANVSTRNDRSLAGAKRRVVTDIMSTLENMLVPIESYNMVYKYKESVTIDPTQAIQNGDIVRYSVLVHKKI